MAVLLALLVLAGVVGGAAVLVVKLASGLHTSSAQGADYPGPGSGSVLVQVKSGQTAQDVATTLKAAGVVQSRTAFLDAASANNRSTKIQPGYYSLPKQMKAADALELIVGGSAHAEKKVLIREGMRSKDILAALAKGTGIPLGDFDAAVKAPDKLALPDYAKGNVEGFLFPATYEFAPNATAVEVLKQMVARYQVTATKLGIDKGSDPYRTVTMASMLEAEVNNNADYGKAARVLENRLSHGGPIGFDSALHYYYNDDKPLTTERLKADTPYNLRKHAGLPPTPISNPGEATLKAALTPTPGDWQWFLTVDPKTGETLFFSKYGDFTAAKRKYGIDY